MPHSLRQGYLFAIATVSIWSGFVILSRYAQGSGLNAYDLTALRFTVAGFLLFPVWFFYHRVPLFTRQMAAITLVGGLAYPLISYGAFSFSTASHGAVLLSGTLPFSMALVAGFVLHEYPSTKRWLALGVIFIGILCIAIHSLHDLAQTWRGDLMLVGASLLWAIYSTLIKRWRLAPWDVTIGVVLLSALVYLPIYLIFLPKGIAHATWAAIALQSVYQGIIVVIVAMFFYMQAMQKLGPTRLSAMMACVPAVAGLSAVMILNEPFSLTLLLGLFLTSFGAWLGTR